MSPISPAVAGASPEWQPPAWLDRNAYPFTPRALETADGCVRYVDEGHGPPVLLVHGTPTWSFVWRDLIGRLVAAGHRVIAPDHLGFGLSEKPPGARDDPAAHAARLGALLDRLGLADVALVLHDFGGPIGLAWALAHPDRVRALVLLNTWAWPLDDDPRIARGARVAASGFGRLLYVWLNASPRLLMPGAFAERRRLTPALHRQYLAPFPTRADREAPWAFARALLEDSRWYGDLWARRAALARMPALLVWGMRDPTFGPSYLARWRDALPGAEVVEAADAGHFVQEEAPDVLADSVLGFLDRLRRRAAG